MTSSILDSWHLLMRDVKAPETFLDASFYFMIGAALQRRVWVSSTENPVFPNPYMILVGPAGVGKGIALNPMASLLKHHPLNCFQHLEENKHKLDPDMVMAVEEFQAKMLTDKLRNPDNHEPSLLFPVGADATSFEAMVRDNAKSISRMKVAEQHEFAPNKVYTHSSIAFILPELSSLFHSQSDRIIQYLTAIYDSKDYLYRTKHQGVDLVKRPCVSFIAGTTPADIKRLFSERLIDDGFLSRFIFIYEEKNRFYRFGRPELSPEQIAAKAIILEYLKTLSTLFGKAEFTPEAWAYCEEYHRAVIEGNYRINSSTKLDSYYARLELHLMKASQWVHFSRSTDMLITIEDVKKAIGFTQQIEPRMHYALSSVGNNPLHGPGRRVLRFLQNRGNGVTLKDIWAELEGDLRESELREIISTLISLNKIDMYINREDGKTEMYKIVTL